MYTFKKSILGISLSLFLYVPSSMVTSLRTAMNIPLPVNRQLVATTNYNSSLEL